MVNDRDDDDTEVEIDYDLIRKQRIEDALCEDNL